MSLHGFATLSLWPDDVPAAAAWYAEFRVGDHRQELGISDSRWRPDTGAGHHA